MKIGERHFLVLVNHLLCVVPGSINFLQVGGVKSEVEKVTTLRRPTRFKQVNRNQTTTIVVFSLTY